MVQVLPGVPTFGSRLAAVLGNAAGDIGEGLGKRKDRRALDAELRGLESPVQGQQQPAPGQYEPQPNQAGNQPSQIQPVNLASLYSKAERVLGKEGARQLVEAQLAKQKAGEKEASTIRGELRARRGEGLKDTEKQREDLAERAQAASLAIKSEENLLEKVATGNLDDPTVAALIDVIPFKLGERFLSPESVEYRSELINEYNQLRTLFKGQTRVEEIKLLTNKLAGLHLTDEQKGRVLKNSIKKLEGDVIRGKIGAELEEEHPEYGKLQFQRELEKRAKPELEKVLGGIVDEYGAIVKEAEQLKKTPLSADNPQHLSLVKQFLDKAGGNKKKAKALMEKAGYHFANE